MRPLIVANRLIGSLVKGAGHRAGIALRVKILRQIQGNLQSAHGLRRVSFAQKCATIGTNIVVGIALQTAFRIIRDTEGVDVCTAVNPAGRISGHFPGMSFHAVRTVSFDGVDHHSADRPVRCILRFTALHKAHMLSFRGGGRSLRVVGSIENHISGLREIAAALHCQIVEPLQLRAGQRIASPEAKGMRWC